MKTVQIHQTSCGSVVVTSMDPDAPPGEYVDRATVDALVEALRAVKVRLHFVGMPQEAFTEGGLPDWRKQIALIESALAPFAPPEASRD